MFCSSALLAFVFSALLLESLASPVIRDAPKLNLAFTTSFRGTNIVAADRARANALCSDPSHRDPSIPVVNTGFTYTANVGVGNPPTDYTLLIDTGSSNTWIGANKTYVQTKTSSNTNLSVSIRYGSGSMTGTEFVDEVTLCDGLVIKNQSIGVASSTTGFTAVDGILGIGPVDLTNGTLSDKRLLVPTVTDNLRSQGTISDEVIGIFYEPFSVSPSPTGELTFGGVDTSHTTSDIQFTPITDTFPASFFWGINQTISYGNTTILSPTSGIVDTGTTLVLLATDAFQKYQKATGATFDQTTGLLTVTNDQFQNLQPLNFEIGGCTYALTPNAQIWPRSFNTEIGGNPGQIYLIVADLGPPPSNRTSFDFINGFAFLERYYSVYDTTNSRIGFATTPFTYSDTN